MASVVVVTGIKKNTCYNDVGLRHVQNMLNVIGFVVDMIGKIHDIMKRKKVLNLISCEFCILTSVLKVVMTVFKICDCQLD